MPLADVDQLPATELQRWRAIWRAEGLPHEDRLEILLACLCTGVNRIGGGTARIEDFLPWLEGEEPTEETAAEKWRASRDAMIALSRATSAKE